RDQKRKALGKSPTEKTGNAAQAGFEKEVMPVIPSLRGRGFRGEAANCTLSAGTTTFHHSDTVFGRKDGRDLNGDQDGFPLMTIGRNRGGYSNGNEL
ncbi:MAG: hypothetical protein PHG54_12715, partial [Smithellaceae bacterium]|nr:hypothetical protein [Smithellaceae bacterium]